MNIEDLENIFSDVYIVLAAFKDRELQTRFDKAYHYALHKLNDIKTYCEIAFRDSEENDEPITRKDLEYIYEMLENYNVLYQIEESESD